MIRGITDDAQRALAMAASLPLHTHLAPVRRADSLLWRMWGEPRPGGMPRRNGLNRYHLSAEPIRTLPRRYPSEVGWQRRLQNSRATSRKRLRSHMCPGSKSCRWCQNKDS
jgi:hypothetical protein